MTLLKTFLDNYFREYNFNLLLDEFVNKYNQITGEGINSDNLNCDIVLRMMNANLNYNLDNNGTYHNVLSWCFIFELTDLGIISDNLVNMFSTPNLTSSDLIELLKNKCFKFECATNVYNDTNDYIISTYKYMNMDYSNGEFFELLFNTLRMWQGQLIKVSFDFNSYLNKQPNETMVIHNKDDSSLRINKTQKVVSEEENEYQNNVANVNLNVNFDSYKNKVESLIDNGVKQIIFTGAPGTGKTYLAKEIAKTYGNKEGVSTLNGKNYQLVQFHTSFDYTDFVEGLRPMESRDKVVEFRKIDGIFKEFCRHVEEENIKAIYGEDSRLGNKETFERIYLNYVRKIIKSSYDGDYCNLNEPKVNYELRMKLKDAVTDDSLRLIENTTFGQIADGNIDKFMQVHIDSNIKVFNPEVLTTIFDSDDSTRGMADVFFEKAEDGKSLRWRYKDLDKKYFFIIDEINRADLSKVLGELMYCFEKDKRGPNNAVQTQYRNLVTYACDKKRELARFEDVFVNGFFIPENVVIIGTMNDIDRSVESMDFALRRRFIFEEFFVDFDNLMVAFTSPSFKFDYDLALRLASSTCLLNKFMHIHGEQYGINSHYDISQGQFSDVNRKIVREGQSKIKDFVWNYRVKSLLREYLRGENETEVNNFIEDARNVFYSEINFNNNDLSNLIKNASAFFNKILNSKIKKDEVENLYKEIINNTSLDQTKLWIKIIGE